MKRAMVALVIAFVMVVGLATSADAADLGNRTYSWPKHCNARVTMIVRQATTEQVEGLMRVYDPCKGAIGHVTISYIRLYKRDGNTGLISVIGDTGAFTCSATLNCDGSYDWYLRTSRAFCNSNGNADTLWSNAKYKIAWNDPGRTSTALRNDNSYNVVLSPFANCAGP